MKQSTFSAVMANSIKNLLQGYTKGIRFVAVLMVLLTMGIGQAWGAEATATLSFASTAQRVSQTSSQQVWSNDGITFTNNKASSSTAVGNYSKPVRLYAGSNVIVEHTSKKITKIVFDCNSSSYATAMKNSIGTVSGATVTVSSDKVTVTFTTAVASFTVAKLTEQVRLDSITVTYNAGWILKGSFDNWGDGVEMTEVSTGKATATLNLAANTYEFKFVNGSNWLGNSGTINADISNWVFKTTEDSNVKLNSGLGGTFTFTIDYSASTTQPKVTVTYPRKTIYLKPGVWNADGAKYAIYYFINGQDGWSGLMTQGTCDKDVYSATIPQWNGLKMDLVRLNSDATAGDWNKKWNQTNDITINSNDYVTITGWDQANFTYTTYTPPTYTITFSGNGNTGGSMTNVSGIPCEGSTTLATNGYTRTGYTFTNWKTNVAVTANSSSVDANGSVANKATLSNITSNITLTAQWKANTYTITYKDGGNTNFSGTHESGYPTTHTYGTATTLKNATKTGYTFDGWYKESACTNKVTSLGANAYTANITLYAKWTPITYSINWVVNGAPYENGGSTEAVHNSTYQDLTLPTDPEDSALDACYPQKVFVGWSTHDLGYEETTEPDDLFTSDNVPDTEITADTTFYAVFATKTDGGTISTPYKFTISSNDFNTTSYAANNSEKTSTATATDASGATMTVKWTSNQVMKQTSNMQWQKNTGYIYNSTDLGTITSVTVTSSAGDFTTHYGTSAQPSAGSQGDGKGYFKTSVGSATGQTTKVEVFFTKSTTSPASYSGYVSKCYCVTGIALSMTDGHQNLDVGQTNQLVVTYTPAEATCDKEIVSWTSSNDLVISVDSTGLVTANMAGTATITAKTAGGVTATYTITVNNPACDSWYIHYWNNSTQGDECFYKVKPDDPNDHEWRTGNFSLPSFSNEDMFIVNNAQAAGGDSQKTDQIFRTGIGFADIQRGGQDCGTNPYPGQDAYGQLSIYDDSNSPNRYIAFYPAQYLVTYGKDGAASWEVLPLNNTTGYEYETEPFMVPNGYKTDDTYKYYVGITDKNGNIKYVGYEFGGVEYKKSSVDAMNTVNGLSTSDMAGKWGVWHIWSNSCANNWYCEFIHYYRVEFNLNGGEGNFAPRYGKATEPYVKFTTTDIGAPTRTGYTFLGWKDQNNKIYAPTDATVTINKDLTLTALWIEEYPSTNCRWEEVTIEDIVYGDEVVIATYKNGKTYALKDDDGGASTAPPAEEITINSNKTINTEETPISNALIWNIDYDKEDTKKLVIYSTRNAGEWLYSINDNNGIRVGTNANKEFKIVEGTGDDAGNFFLYHIAQARYLGVYYQGPDWRGYTTINTNNITGQTLKLYKKVCLPEGQYRVTWDANGGQWSDGSTKKEEIYTVDATITKPADPTREGYKFTGWNPNPTTMPAQNTTFTAQWAELHTITWMVGSSSVLTEEVANGTAVTQTPGDDIADDAIGDCADTFLGWSEKSAGSTPQDAAYYDNLCTAEQMKSKHNNVTGDKTFYAVFATAEETEGGTMDVTTSVNIGTYATANSWEDKKTYSSITIDENITAKASKSGGSTSNTGYYSSSNAHWRFYQTEKSSLAITAAENCTIQTVKVTYTAENSGVLTYNGSNQTSNESITINATSATFGVGNNSDKTNGQVRITEIEIAYVKPGGTTITYSNYVTNCCALAPATNLTVSGTTANSATLTWTAPSSTTGITKLQVRNAETDAVVVDNIAVNTTSTTIDGLTECTSYQYYVVSVGEDCEVVSNTVTATPFSGAKTVNYNYNGGTGSPASFTTNCTNQTITLPAATRTGYDFNGWYTAATGGTRVGDAGETYEPATSPVTLYAQWTIKSYTVTWNPNGGNWDGNISNIVQTYEYGAAINKPDDPTRENGIFKGWTPTPASTMPAGNKTYTAQWEMVYTLTFVDMNAGGTTSTLTQTSSGQNIVAPIANSEVCDMWTFIGWAPSNSLNGDTNKPTGFIAAGETIFGSQITGNKTYYSVYSYNSDNTQEFEVGKSGTYLMYALSSGTKYYATTAKTGGFYGNPETSFATYGPSKFTLTYNKTEEKYIIYHENTTSGRESQGYFELNTSDGNVDVKSETPSLFTIQAGSNGAFIIRTDYTDSRGTFKERSFGYDDSFTDYSGDNPVYFEPASEIQYYNAADCGEVETYTMSFHNPFGDENALIWYDAEHEKSYYTDKPRNTSIDVFPTMVYNGWAFIGWTANRQYNEFIGEENLDDENSATDDPASSFTIYSNTAGWAYTLNDNVTMYPVFTKYEDNEDIDLGSGGEYYMYFYREGEYYKDEYFGADNHYKRMYALAGGGDNGEFKYTTNCNDAQIFEFIKEGDGWNIRVKNADGSYPTKSYLVNTSGNDYDLVSTKPSSKWSITKEPEGDYTMWYKGNTTNQTTPGFYVAKAREYSGGSSWNFKCYNQDNDASQFYYKVYLGTCENRVFSSNPTNKPIVTLTGKPIVTSTQDQSIRAQGELSISATKLAANGTITLTSDNADVYFSTVKDANFTQATKPLASLPLYADEKGKLATTTVYVHYKPTSTSTPGVQTANITATTGTNGQPDYATATTTAALRNLPADFVIAAKWGDNWYALPANMDSQSSTEGLLIEVDDAANPTKAIAAPNTTKYGVKSVYTSNSTADRYADNGERLVFVENVEETTPVTNKTLYNGGDASGSKTNIQVYAQYANYYSDQNQAPRYEWIPTTTDLTDYTLTSGAILSGDAVGRTVSLDNHGIFGTLLQDKSYKGMVRLLPVDNFYAPVELQVVEWKADGVNIMYTGNGTKATTKVGENTESDVQVLSKVSIDHAVYTLSTSDLTTATNQPLIISIKNDAEATIGIIKLTIPWIVDDEEYSTDQVASEVANATEIVILDNATLTATDTKYTFHDITVYPGGSLVIGDDGKLGMYSLTMRAGSSWGALEYENKYPQFLLKGEYSNTSAQINLDYVTTVDYYYPLSVPEEVTIADIKYPVDIYGSNVEKTNKGSFQLKYYDGAQRVDQGSQYGTGWVVVDESKTTTLAPNQGYAIWGIPKKINGTRQTYGIHRIPIKIAAGTLKTNESKDEEVAIEAHGVGTEGVSPNDQGWNYLGNPYLAGLGGMNGDDEVLQIGQLVEEKGDDGNWTGGWEYVGDLRYITVTNDCQNYTPIPVTEAKISPFTTFFVQACQDGAIALTSPVAVTTSSLAARRYAVAEQTAKEITTGILLTGNDQTDRTGLLISDEFTEEYDFNADLSKFENSGINLYTIGKDGKLAYMAINQVLAEQPIPVGYSAPAEGLYTIAFDEDRYNANDISALYLIDYDSNEKTNLLHTDYSFVTAAGTNNQRFALQVAFAPENATNVEWVGDATIQVGVEGTTLIINNLPTDAAVHVFDALGRLMYHTPHAPTEMQLTLPTGYYLVRIADKQHAAVINTVIP